MGTSGSKPRAQRFELFRFSGKGEAAATSNGRGFGRGGAGKDDGVEDEGRLLYVSVDTYCGMYRKIYVLWYVSGAKKYKKFLQDLIYVVKIN